jgi:geranylgeranyl diphosphate synthase type I
MDKLQQYKREVDAFLIAFLASKQKDFARVNAWGPDAIGKIRGIVSEGKTIRGSLVLCIHDLLKGNRRDQAIRVAAAYECIHTALLIHDDIMDHDTIRRGKPTLHVQYNNEGLAICVGDILFFLANELLDQTPVQKISAQVFQEVGVAQMQDVSFGLTSYVPTKEEILSLYTYKTARYTFSLPMMAGAMLARADTKTIELFEHLGESLGILFQIKNDAHGVQGDIREHKKTLARYYPVRQEVDTLYREAMKSLRVLDRQADTTTLEELLTFVTPGKR